MEFQYFLCFRISSIKIIIVHCQHLHVLGNTIQFIAETFAYWAIQFSFHWLSKSFYRKQRPRKYLIRGPFSKWVIHISQKSIRVEGIVRTTNINMARATKKSIGSPCLHKVKQSYNGQRRGKKKALKSHHRLQHHWWH